MFDCQVDEASGGNQVEQITEEEGLVCYVLDPVPTMRSKA